ncbi:MAG TPA: AAA family ATPase, partial [Leptospiraceae bacterium]|nr:AAA family ATPase [Leptospiraceae bacterium]
MNRTVDYRSDYYSLGITFYQMLSGVLPFESNEIMEMIHFHIAVNPVPLKERQKSVPESLSDLVMKLMKKNPEDRYQSAEGILYDIREIRDNFEKGRSRKVQIGRMDFSSKFQIPERLYGREKEIERIIECFNDMYNYRKNEMILVSGASGMGKSALIQEVYKPVTGRKGYFIQGKFDQYKRDLPYNAFIQAFGELVSQILTEDNISVSRWKADILAAAGENAFVLTELIPELELLIGVQPKKNNDLPAQESMNRFIFSVRAFVGVFAKFRHPLALFLDDIQWADSSSVRLIRFLYTDPSIESFLLICSFRENEIDSSHPFSVMLGDLEKEKQNWKSLKVGALSVDDIGRLAADTLNCSINEVREIAETVHSRTGGNPFFVIELMKSLYSEGMLIPPSAGEKTWRWNIAEIRSVNITGNVVDLMAGKIRNLPSDSSDLLLLASCIGIKFDFEILASVSGLSLRAVSEKMKKIADEGMITAEGYSAKFSHDKVREAAYSLIPSEKKMQNHYILGKKILETSPPEMLEENIFTILAQLNPSRHLIESEEEKQRLIVLNLQAGRKAKASLAYDRALIFLKTGSEFLTEKKWLENYRLCMDVLTELAECEYLAGNFRAADILYERILPKAADIHDKISIIHIQLRQKASEFKPDEAFVIGFSVLKELGIEVPDIFSPEEVQSVFLHQLEKFKTLMQGKHPSDLFELPEMQDRGMKEAISVITNLGDIAIAMKQELLGLSSIMGVNLSLEYGNAEVSPISYVMWGVISVFAFREYESGYEFGQLSLRLNSEKFPSDLIMGKILAFYGWNIHHWKHHILHDIEIGKKGYETAMKNSDLVYSGYFAAMFHCAVPFFAGLDLETVVDGSRKAVEFSEKYSLSFLKPLVLSHLQISLSLGGKTDSENSFSSPNFDETGFIKAFSSYSQSMAYYYLRRFQFYFIYNNYEGCLSVLPEMEKYFPAIPGHIAFSEFYFFRTVFFCSVSKENADEEKISQGLDFLKQWSEICPDNFLHKFQLASALNSARLNSMQEATELFESALNNAIKYNYNNDAALTAELAGRFFLFRGSRRAAQSFLQDSYFYYSEWKAFGKTRQMEEIYPEAVSALKKMQHRESSVSNNPTFSSTDTRHLDLDTVLKASQALSGEIQLSRLLEKMMKLIFENAGAERGSFLLKQDDVWKVYAKAESGRGAYVLEGIDLDSSGHPALEHMSLTIIHYVTRSGSQVMLSDASKSMFGKDEYIIKNNIKSVLCYPVRSQGKLIGTVYLENSLTSDAFTPDRVELLRVLSAQTAVSLENSILYSSLEKKVEERTRSLEYANAELEKLAQSRLRLSAVGEMVSGLVHDIKNPIGTVKAFAEMLKDSETDHKLREEYADLILRETDRLG